MINCAVISGVVFKKFRDQTISKCLYNLFLTVKRTCRISLAGLAIYSVLFTYHSLNKFIAVPNVLYLPN